MEDSLECVLCGATGPMDRWCGLNVCEPCRLGRLEPGLIRWGLAIDERQWTQTRRVGKRDITSHHVAVTVRLAQPIDARATFRVETLLDRAVDLIRRAEPRGGDPLFDRMVFVGGAEGAQLQALVEDEGVQATLLELVPHTPVRLVPADLSMELEWDEDDEDEPDPMALTVALVLLAVHVQTVSSVLGTTGP